MTRNRDGLTIAHDDERMEGGWRERSIPSDECMWEVAPESMTQELEFWSAIWFRAAMRPA